MRSRFCRSQRGVTLISLLIGITISMIAMVAMMMVFRNVASASLDARESSSAEGRSTSAASTVSILMQEAGYGISSPQLGTHLVVISGASLEGNILSGTAVAGSIKAGNAVVWAAQTGIALRCAGLYAPSGGGLLSLPAVDCTSAGTWNTLSWAPVTLVPSPPAASDIDKVDGRVPVVFGINARIQSCKVFGVTHTAGNVVVTLVADHSRGERMSSTAEQCLANFPVPVAPPAA
jgi:hypothetical protein